MKYQTTIGLEIHAELKTKSKMFCACKNDPDEEKPNVNICPICLGHPGTLPTLNHEAIQHVLKVGVAIGGDLADFTEWDRKNYFYPDIPKGYQISQYKYPLVSNGELAGVAVERVHLEEDTAQSTHDTHEKSLINFNRSGVPLMEIVTKPVIHDAATAVRYAKELQLLLRYLGAGDANMEKGEMRVEANISVAPISESVSSRAESPFSKGGGESASQGILLGTKTEVKNLNSFRAVEKAIEFEVLRQIALIEKGDKVSQETRGWNDIKGETYSQRSKESSHDYRYFPDPDIPKMKVSEMKGWSKAELIKDLPELHWVKRDRYKKVYAMTDKETAVFVDSPAAAKYYEDVISPFSSDTKRIKLSTNYILSDYLGLISKDTTLSISSIAPGSFSELITMLSAGEISSRGAKDLIPLLIKQGKGTAEAKLSVKSFAEKNGLLQKSSAEDIEPAIDEVIKANPGVVDEYKKGKVASLQFLIGQAMKATKGAANPTIVKELLMKNLDKNS